MIQSIHTAGSSEKPCMPSEPAALGLSSSWESSSSIASLQNATGQNRTMSTDFTLGHVLFDEHVIMQLGSRQTTQPIKPPLLQHMHSASLSSPLRSMISMPT